MPSQPAPVPPDDLSRKLTVARPDHDQSLPHIGLVGAPTRSSSPARRPREVHAHRHARAAGRRAPPHRHDFEEMFTVLTAKSGDLPRRDAHRPRRETSTCRPTPRTRFTNAADTPSRLLCMCAPSGQEEFFTLVGQPVATRTEAPPPLDAGARAPSSPSRGRSRPSTRPNCFRRPARNKGREPR